MSPLELREFLFGAPRHVHLIGVAGSGMSGIAALLLGLGHRVSGSDKATTAEVERLCRKGLVFSMPHTGACVVGAELVVRSSAVRAGNAAFDEARRLEIPTVRRADALAAVMSAKMGVVVCGMHGKTTTSAMAAHVLRQGGFKPSHYVGAEIPILGTNARWDSEGTLFVAEGDESDGTLVNYSPGHAIVLNIEPEHLDFYPDLAAIDAVFKRLCEQTSGWVVFCGDDEGARRVCAGHPGAISYGLGEANRYRMESLVPHATGSDFAVVRDGVPLGTARLDIPGVHNACNALAVVALATELGMPFPPIAEALAGFRGAKRRFEILHSTARNTVVDDYGHHPTEIAAVLSAARAASPSRVLVMFQPHRYTRTAALRDAFGEALAAADAVFVADVYAAGEQPLPGVSGRSVVDALRERGHSAAMFEPRLERLHAVLGPHLRDGDMVLSLGAGNIHEAAARLCCDLVLRDRILGVMGSGLVRLHEPLSKHTTLRVGGPAQFWVEPETESGFADLARFCGDEEIPLTVMGRGSNLLVRDGGIRGVVAHLARGEFQQCEIQGNLVIAGVGVKLKRLAAVARAAGLGGFEWMDGIPGNLGGALRMNAGAMGVQTFDQVVKVRVCDEDGNIVSRAPSELEIRYRDVPTLRRNFALSATLEGIPCQPGEILARMAESETKRRESQPAGASAGCIFKNPEGIPAGRLVEELGFKNTAVGGARVSGIHANFIVNEGGASATDVLALIGQIQSRAAAERGIDLETEVQIVGEDV
jgi:UDP-N-acetylmuramate--L-alanine ligase/UDP-N-acetylenolpyruvoylglucosamine reductase